MPAAAAEARLEVRAAATAVRAVAMAVAIAEQMEVVASQVLMRAGEAAAAGSSGRIEPHHIRSAVRRDDDLARLVGSEALEQGGLLRPDQPSEESSEQ